MLWTLFTIILVAALTLLVVYILNKKIEVKWWEWVIFGVGVLLFVFALQNTFGAAAEGETKAGFMFLWTLGIPAVVLIGVPCILVQRRRSVE